MTTTVLIIDDDPRIARALTIRLEAAGLRVHTAARAADGINAATSLRPDLVILDIRLPDSDGFEVCRNLRALHALAATPVIFHSAHSQQHFRDLARDAGGDRFLTKPARGRELLDAIEELTNTPTPGDPP